jgi:hypothetical protein
MDELSDDESDRRAAGPDFLSFLGETAEVGGR